MGNSQDSFAQSTHYTISEVREDILIVSEDQIQDSCADIIDILFTKNHEIIQPKPLPPKNPLRIRSSNFQWMKDLDDSLYITDLSVPGTHNSGADHYFPPIASLYIVCQEHGIPKQLEQGIRFFDIRCRRCGTGHKSFLAIYHGRYYQHKKFEEVLDTFQEFLRENPSETVVMRIKEEFLPEYSSTPRIEEILDRKYFENSRWKELFYRGEAKIPRLKELRGKVFLILERFRSEKVSYIGWDDEFCEIQDAWKYGKNVKKQSMLSHYEKFKGSKSEKLRINFISLSPNPLLTIPTLAKVLNRVILAEFKENSGVVVMDFPTLDVINWIIDLNESKTQKKVL